MSDRTYGGFLAAACLLALLFGGCGGPEASVPPPADPDTAADSATAPASGPKAEPAAESAVRSDVVAVKQMLEPWTGDLDGMVERRYIRFLVAYNKTHYFFDGPQQRGITYEAGKGFEEFLNQRLGRGPGAAGRVNVDVYRWTPPEERQKRWGSRCSISKARKRATGMIAPAVELEIQENGRIDVSESVADPIKLTSIEPR